MAPYTVTVFFVLTFVFPASRVEICILSSWMLERLHCCLSGVKVSSPVSWPKAPMLARVPFGGSTVCLTWDGVISVSPQVCGAE